MPEPIEAVRKHVREAVILFEHKEGSRQVDIKEIPTLVRSLGVNPTVMQTNLILDQIASMSTSDSTLIPLENIEIIVANFLIQQDAALFRDDYHILIRAFRAFDPEGKGYVLAEQIRAALQSKGEPLTDDELSRMVGFAADENGRIYCESNFCPTHGRIVDSENPL
jgi:Ca2+-binding EF-hand superfamily protein